MASITSGEGWSWVLSLVLFLPIIAYLSLRLHALSKRSYVMQEDVAELRRQLGETALVRGASADATISSMRTAAAALAGFARQLEIFEQAFDRGAEIVAASSRRSVDVVRRLETLIESARRECTLASKLVEEYTDKVKRSDDGLRREREKAERNEERIRELEASNESLRRELSRLSSEHFHKTQTLNVLRESLTLLADVPPAGTDPEAELLALKGRCSSARQQMENLRATLVEGVGKSEDLSASDFLGRSLRVVHYVLSKLDALEKMLENKQMWTGIVDGVAVLSGGVNLIEKSLIFGGVWRILSKLMRGIRSLDVDVQIAKHVAETCADLLDQFTEVGATALAREALRADLDADVRSARSQVSERATLLSKILLNRSEGRPAGEVDGGGSPASRPRSIPLDPKLILGQPSLKFPAGMDPVALMLVLKFEYSAERRGIAALSLSDTRNPPPIQNSWYAEALVEAAQRDTHPTVRILADISLLRLGSGERVGELERALRSNPDRLTQVWDACATRLYLGYRPPDFESALSVICASARHNPNVVRGH